MTTVDTASIPVVPRYAPAQRVTGVRVVRSEWTKLRSLPSTAWSLLSALVLVVGFSATYALVRVTRPPRDTAAASAFDPTAVSLAGVHLAQLAIGILGVLFITGEYATGSIRSSLAAVPARLPVLWGKAVVYGLTALVLCVPATIAAFLVGQSILAAENLDTTLGAPGTARAVLGSALYLAAVGLLGLGLGALLRNTAGAIGALFGLLFGLQLVAGFLPEPWSVEITRYLPVPAGTAVTSVQPDQYSLAPWTGFGVFCLYVALALGLAAWQLRRRDA
jgi:ABC-type transport system involved in multi-copper enzyme maturation permease subunit